MVKELDPKQTKRAQAFELWMQAPMPMVTLFKTLDISRLVKISQKKGYKLNMLMCWCIGMAASKQEEFYLLPIEDKMVQYDALAVNVVVMTANNDIATCDIPFSSDLSSFNQTYLNLTQQVYHTGIAYDVSEDYMVIGTSALPEYEIDGAVNIYAGFYNNPFVVWGKYHKKWRKNFLPISFQFHHTQMDGIPAARFLDNLQAIIHKL